MGFTDADGTPIEVPEPPASGSNYAEIGAFQGLAYRRNAFARGTQQEATILSQVLDLRPGARLLDVGCGNGRHVAAFRQRGVRAVGLDLSREVLAAAPPGSAVVGEAIQLPIADRSMDALMSVCQGGFGLTAGHDERSMSEWHRVLRPGGRLAFTAFSLVFAVRWMADGDAIDVARGLHHHLADIRDSDGSRRGFDLWTTAYSVPHLRALLTTSGFEVLGVAGVEAGTYRTTPEPTVADPEVLFWAERR